MRERLVEAAEQNDHEKIRELLTAGAAVDGVAEGRMPLTMAANHAHLESCQVLLEHGADSARAVKYAVASRNARTPALLELLLKFGCPIQALFREAVWRGRVKDATVVLNAGARLDHPDDNGYPLFLRASQNSSKMIRFLLTNGLIPGRVPNDSYALPYCASLGHYGRLTTLLECKFEQQYLDTALYNACLGGNYRCAQLLLSSGADPNGGELATLSAACRHGSLKLVELLLKHAVDLDRRGNDGKTGLEWAVDLADGDFLAKVLNGSPKSKVRYRWTTNPRTGEKALEVRNRTRTYRWTCCHADIVKKLRQLVPQGS
jgi:ankyrin repeat/SOCS box protein 2